MEAGHHALDEQLRNLIYSPALYGSWMSRNSYRALKEGCADMSIEQATDLVRHTLILALIVSSPMLVIGLVVGVVVSLLQAITQIQEQSLSFIPKIVAMISSVIILMPWIGHRLIEYTAAMFTQ
jgi:flagellar biosynthesis protein FliQ